MTSKPSPDQAQANLKKICPELKALPEGWLIKADINGRIYFLKLGTATTVYDHPCLGPLPRPWILKLCKESGTKHLVPKYYNRDTKVESIRDPRFSPEYLKSRTRTLKKDALEIVGSLRKMTSDMPLEHMKRADIGKKDIRDKYEIVKVIDPGNGSVGGMNGGVFVVRMKNQTRLSVEKRFKADGVTFGRKEIEMLHRLKHGSLTFYTAGFIVDNPPKASVYVEFCDRGSLGDLIQNFARRRIEAGERHEPKPFVPERFIWHAFAGLCDGLAYLRGGRSYVRPDVYDTKPVDGWVPILHRDMKPDNVLFRSRDTLGSKRYWYCVLSDFGLACEDLPNSHPEAEQYQRNGLKLGTKLFFAPELCQSPYPKRLPWTANPELEFRSFPEGRRHSEKSDLWALGASIYNLAECEAKNQSNRPSLSPFAHLELWKCPGNVDINTFMEGTASRKPILMVNGNYTLQLRQAIDIATQWDPRSRPTAAELVHRIKVLMKQAGYEKFEPANKNEEIPSWATKVHDLHSMKAVPSNTY